MFNRWLNPLFKIGHKRKLEEDDMYSVLPEDRSQHLGEELQGWAQAAGRTRGRVRISTVWAGFAFLWVLLNLLPWHCTLTPLRLTPVLAHFGRSASLYSLCISASGGSPQLRPWRLNSVPRGGIPGVLLSPGSLCSLHDRPMNLRDKVLKQGIWLYSESWLTQKMANWWLRVTIL